MNTNHISLGAGKLIVLSLFVGVHGILIFSVTQIKLRLLNKLKYGQLITK